MRLRSLFAAMLTCAAAVELTWGQTLITFPTRAEAGSISGVPVDPSVSDGVLSRGAGLVLNTGGTYNSRSWNEGVDLASAIASDNYYSFTVNSVPGSSFGVTEIVIRYDRSNTGPSNMVILSSVTGFNASATPIHFDNDVNTEGEENTIAVSGHSGLSNIEFRIYAWSSGTQGTFDIEALPSGSGIVVNGGSTPSGDNGACCEADGACRISLPDGCSGTFQGVSTSCAPNPCPQVLGACCFGGVCIADLTRPACLASGAGFTWGGAGTTCATFDCNAPRGACCVGTVCTADLTQMGCTGTFLGAGSVCSPTACPQEITGACCCGAACTLTTSTACMGTFTAFAGAGTSCTPLSLSTPCCRADYNRSGGTVTVQDIFDFLSGYFTASACADVNDSGGVPTVQDIFDYLTGYFAGCQ